MARIYAVWTGNKLVSLLHIPLVLSKELFYFSVALHWSIVQAEEKLDEVGRPKTTPLKVKVISGATASFNRIPVNKPVQLSGSQIDQRRDYANYVLQQRLDTVELKHHNHVRKLYFPYIQNT